jgi:hypothetical protein
MTQQYQQERELGWDDTITQDSEGGITLAPGDYIFEVAKFERARYTPGPNSKLPACNMAKLELKIQSDQGSATVFNNLYLHSSTEGLLSAFFASIGQKVKGAPLQMNWNMVTGAKGAVKIKNRTYNDNTYNDVASFYASDPSYYQNKEMPAIVQQLHQSQQGYQAPPAQNYQQPALQQQAPAQNYQQQTPPPAQPQAQGYQPGAF